MSERFTQKAFEELLREQQQPITKQRVVDEKTKETCYRMWKFSLGNKGCTLSFDSQWWTFEIPGVGCCVGTSSPIALRLLVAAYIRFVDGKTRGGMEINPDDIAQIAKRLDSIIPDDLPKIPAGEQRQGVCGSGIFITVFNNLLLSITWWEVPYVALLADGVEIQSWEGVTVPESWYNALMKLRELICIEGRPGVNCVCNCPPAGICRETWEAALAAGIPAEELEF